MTITHQLRTRSVIGGKGALRAVLQPTKLRTRSIIGWHGTLRRQIHGMLVVIIVQANHVTVLPNNSFKLSPNGMSRWPSSAGPAAHFALAAQHATPSVPA